MARINSRKKSLLQNASGRVGKTFVVKQYKHGIVIANYPDMSRVKPSPAQTERREQFAAAVRYARYVLKDPKLKSAYARKLKGHTNAFQAALAAYLDPEKRKGIDEALKKASVKNRS